MRGHSCSPLLILLCVLPLACRSAAEHREDADREVYALLAERRQAFTSDPQGFTIEPDRSGLEALLGEGEHPQLGPLTLVEVLRVAAANSRDYQDRKERLYLSALDLTLERFRFQVQRNAGLGGLLTGSGDDAQLARGDAGAGFTRLLGTGARIVGDLGLSIFRDLSRGDGFDVVSTVGLSLTQPLLRGAGRRIVEEPLTQAERNVVYEVRSFERFRRSFAFDVATRYFRVLQQVDAVRNEEANAANLQLLRSRNESLAEAGRLSAIQVDQARQDELRSRNRLIQAQQSLDSQLDSLKLFMGLPIAVRLSLSSDELARLAELEAEVEPDEGAVIDLALRERLDYLTAQDQVDDRRRRVHIAADALRNALNIGANANAVSPEGRPLDIDADDVQWRLTADLDLAIDRLPQRNAYRESLIALQDAEREAERLADTIRVALRNDLRNGRAGRETYLIQLRAVELATTRVESSRLSLEAGRATTRDILESQSALLEAQNAATRALIDFQLSILALYLDLEALRLEESGIVVDEELRSALLEMAE